MASKQKITVTERADGTIRIEAIGTTEKIDRWDVAEIDPDPLMIDGEQIADSGDCGCLYAGDDIRTATTAYVGMVSDPEGLGGNVDPSVKSLDGWRGTTNDIATYAMGWREVMSVEPRKRGVGWVAILSKPFDPTDADERDHLAEIVESFTV